MIIELYKNTSDNRVINKSITLINTYPNAVFKDDTDVVNPVLIFDGSFNFNNINYIHIPSLNRYYYIGDITLSQRRQYVSCHIDVLMTYKNYLLNKTVILSRSASAFNTMQIDRDMPQDNENVITTLPFANSFQGESLILTVAGGAST